MCEDFTKEKENMKENARKEMKQDVKQIQIERDNEIQRIYARFVLISISFTNIFFSLIFQNTHFHLM